MTKRKVKLPDPLSPGALHADVKPEYTGLSVGYYKVQIKRPTSLPKAYTAECNDIIEALGMNYAEGNEFKALWRSCAARALGLKKKGQDDDGIYDAEKAVFFAERTLAARRLNKQLREAQIADAEQNKKIPSTIKGEALTESKSNDTRSYSHTDATSRGSLDPTAFEALGKYPLSESRN